MPADDLVLNVRQIAGYPDAGNAQPSDSLLLQRGGLGGAYSSVLAQYLVSAALTDSNQPLMVGVTPPTPANGGQVISANWCSQLDGSLLFNAYTDAAIVDRALAAGHSGYFNVDPATGRFQWGLSGLWGAGAAITYRDVMLLTQAGDLSLPLGTLSVGRDPIAPGEAVTLGYLDTVLAQSVRSFNMRFGDIMLTVDDIICAGGAPIFSPAFQGSPRASTPPPWSNSSRVATTAFVQMALANAVDLTGYAPLDSPAFSGVPSAPTAAPGSSDGQLATTAFVMAAVASSVTGVASFNGRTGLVVLTAADLTGVGGALLANPTFTGLPSAPTAAPTTNTTQLATTQFVQAAVAAIGTGVTSFNTRTGAVTLTAADIGAVGVSAFNGRLGAVFLIANDVSAAGGALLASPVFTGVPSAPTAVPATNTAQLATTAFVQAAVATATSGVQSFNGRAGVVTLTAADLTGVGGALLANPVFTGVPSAPTAAPATSTTQLATTAFVMAAVSAATAGVSSFNSRTGVVTLIANDISGAGGALLASPVFTGVPSAPTATLGTNTAQLATCAFVMAAIAALPTVPIASATAPLINGAASAGSSAAWSRGDHVHPTDTSRAAASALASYLPLAGGTLTGPLAGTALTLSGLLTSNSGTVNLNSPTSPIVQMWSAGTVRSSFWFDITTGHTQMLDQFSGAALWIDAGGAFAYSAGTGVAYKTGGGSWTAPASDARTKTVEREYEQGLDDVLQLRPVIYTYKGNDTASAVLDRRDPSGAVVERGGAAPYPGSPHFKAAKAGKAFVGLIAQEVEAIFPGMVSATAGFIDGQPVADLRTLDVSELTYALVNAIKTLAARLTTLEARLT